MSQEKERLIIMLSFKKLLIIVAVLCDIAFADGIRDYEPQKDFDRKLNIAYYQGGEYINYPLMLKSVVKTMSDYGWLKPIDLSSLDSAKEIWNKLADEAQSDYIVFKKDAYYDVEWDKSKREIVADSFIKRLNQKKDIDTIFALGTWAGQDLSNDKHTVPTFVMSVSNPITAGIIESATSSKFAQIHARVDEKRYKRQVSLFYKIIKFKTLGVVYEDSVQGRSYASLSDVELIAKEKKFKLKRCKVNPKSSDIKKDIIKCYKKLSKTSNAIYITTHPAYKAEDLESFISVINSKKIPTFSQVGQSHVKYGALMSISRANFKYLGEFHAQVIGRSLNGAKPSQMSFIFQEPVKLAINIETATLIDWDIPLSVIAIADEIYQKIQTKDSINFGGR